MKTIKCLHCGRDHALYWYSDNKGMRICYTCDHVERGSVNRLDGRPERRFVTERLELNHDDLRRLTKQELAVIPQVESRNLAKTQAEANQCKLPL